LSLTRDQTRCCGRDVKDVKPNKENVEVLFAGNSAKSTIYLGAESLANRVAYAIAFLRTNCDEAAATGF